MYKHEMIDFIVIDSTFRIKLLPYLTIPSIYSTVQSIEEIKKPKNKISSEMSSSDTKLPTVHRPCTQAKNDNNDEIINSPKRAVMRCLDFLS